MRVGKEIAMGLAKYDEDNFELYAERLRTKGLNMSREWTGPCQADNRTDKKEDDHEKRR